MQKADFPVGKAGIKPCFLQFYTSIFCIPSVFFLVQYNRPQTDEDMDVILRDKVSFLLHPTDFNGISDFSSPEGPVTQAFLKELQLLRKDASDNEKTKVCRKCRLRILMCKCFLTLND